MLNNQTETKSKYILYIDLVMNKQCLVDKTVLQIIFEKNTKKWIS